MKKVGGAFIYACFHIGSTCKGRKGILGRLTAPDSPPCPFTEAVYKLGV